jgi:calmodulin
MAAGEAVHSGQAAAPVYEHISEPFDADTLHEMAEVFGFFDRDHDGRLKADDIGPVIRSLGYSPSEAELSSLERIVHRMFGGSVSWKEFVAFMATHVAEMDRAHVEDPERIQEAFELFGDMYRLGDTGKISVKDLETLVTQRGESLDARSFSYMLRVAPPDADDKIDYEVLVDAVARGARRGPKA